MNARLWSLGNELFQPTTRLLLYSNLHPGQCAHRLSQSIDPEQYTIFSFSGYAGSRPFLGNVEGLQFRVFQRRYRNMPPVLCGTFQSQRFGTRIEGAFDLDRTAKGLLLFCGSTGILVAVAVFANFIKNHDLSPRMALLLACIAIGGAALTPRLIRAFGLDQEREIRDFLCTTLEAGDDLSAYESGRASPRLIGQSGGCADLLGVAATAARRWQSCTPYGRTVAPGNISRR